jgi:hypothetical protein
VLLGEYTNFRKQASMAALGAVEFPDMPELPGHKQTKEKIMASEKKALKERLRARVADGEEQQQRPSSSSEVRILN